jgi:ELWxxDGT repeat protein
VKDINVGTGNGVNTELFAASNNTLYFAGNDNTTGLELWKSDGTNAGTVLVKEINPGTSPSTPRRFVEMNNIIYFNATDGVTSGVEVFKTDGTSAGTSIALDINPGAGNSNPDQITVIDNVMYFFAQDDGTNYDFYKYDGTTLTKLADLNAPGSSVSTNYIKSGTNIIFAADDNDADTLRELWVTDGTVVGTKKVSAKVGGPSPQGVNNVTLVGINILFTAEDATNGSELYKIDAALSNKDNELASNLKMYPNPTTGKITIDYLFESPATYSVYDVTGKTIASGKLHNNTFEINAQKGIYFVKIESNNKSTYKKIIKE